MNPLVVGVYCDAEALWVLIFMVTHIFFPLIQLLFSVD